MSEQKEQGIIRMALSNVLIPHGYKGINIDKIDYDVFSNQIIFKVSGELYRYPHSIEPVPERKAVIGL